MRIELANRSVTLSPGSTGIVDVDVFNTGDTIDGVTGRVVGLDSDWVTSNPTQLALFPETSGRLQLRINLPPGSPAGTHVVTVEATSSADPTNAAYADIEMLVLPLTQATLMLLPVSLAGKRKGRFTLMAENAGNTPVSL